MTTKRTRYGEITKNVLLTLAIAGILTIAATSPSFLINITKAFIKYKKYNKKYKNFNEKSFTRSVSGLNKNKIIIVKEKKGKFTVELTEKGKKVAKEIIFADMKIEKQKVWDKKWRIVIFDIPERRGRRGRDAMRVKLRSLGFCQMQKSVWAYPYPCEKEIRLVCEIYEINSFVNIITADKIYNDDNLKKYFNLSA